MCHCLEVVALERADRLVNGSCRMFKDFLKFFSLFSAWSQHLRIFLLTHILAAVEIQYNFYSLFSLCRSFQIVTSTDVMKVITVASILLRILLPVTLETSHPHEGIRVPNVY